MSTAIAYLARDALSTLRELFGLIPRNLRPDFDRAGFHLPRTAFAPAVRRMCTAVTAKGTPCKNSACQGFDVCRIHYKKSAAAVAEMETIMYCTETTAKGTQCKCRAFRGFEVCQTHARKKGLVTIPTECAICYEEMVTGERTKTKCGHYFHTACLEKWCETKGHTMVSRGKRRYKAPCPMCRQTFTMPTPPPRWYAYNGTPPTIETSGAEWVDRLHVFPSNPIMTQEELHETARQVGMSFLSEYMELRRWREPMWENMVINVNGMTRY